MKYTLICNTCINRHLRTYIPTRERIETDNLKEYLKENDCGDVMFIFEGWPKVVGED